MTRRMYALALTLLAASLILVGCGRSREEPTPTPTKTPVPAAQAPAAPPTDTPVPPTQPPAQQNAAAPAPTPTEAPAVAVINAAELNIRSGPGVNFDIVRVATQGQQFQVVALSEDGTWAQLAENGQPIGWAALEFLALSNAPGESVTTLEQPAAPPAPTEAPAPVNTGYLPATMRSPDFGAQAFLWWRPEVADRDLMLMKDVGFNWVKQAFAWETIEGAGKGQFDWSIADRVVQQVNKDGLKLLARVSTDPEKQNSFWPGPPPANADNFADFLFALASRYNCTPQAVGCIQAYQVWNEPNLAREWGNKRPNPAEYVQFLGKAYAAIKRANPNALVISAGMAPTGDDNDIAMPDDKFYELMYQAMGGNSDGYFDALGVHGAGFAAPPELDPATAAADKKYGGYRFFAFRHVEDIRNIMVRYGDADKQVVILEFGWTFDPVNPSYKWHGADAGIDMFVQADYLKRAYQYAEANWKPWIGLMSLLTMPNLDWLEDGNPEDEEQYWWAIMEPSQIHELRWRPAIIELCIYFNGLNGQRCKYDPNP
ncbi:MAG: glycosyl hydrolase family protein [Caldilineae bacterium]|nr:MAG: glycosyl hydrolase family protein [Caldilineae bacterium]